MSTRQLSEAILDSGLRQVNFANGRLLSAEDMRQEQSARAYADSLLGKARGEGIAFGLEVSRPVSAGSQPQVTVQPGLAINRRGYALALNDTVNLSLVRPAQAAVPGDATFRDCQPPQPGVFVANAGIYLLVISPASAQQGRAPVSGLGSGTAPCSAQFKVDGVQFRLIPVDAGSLLDAPALLRNVIAYTCFGIIDSLAFRAAPFDVPWVRTGLLDVLRANQLGLTDCDVPLAMVYWTAAGIQFVDTWSVRRRLTQPAAVAGWPLLFSDRRAAEGEAMIQQFQAQIDEIFDIEPTPEQLTAADRFQFLPPGGLLPIRGDGSSKGFDPKVFFGDHGSSSIGTIDGAQLRPLFQEALAHEPIALAAGERVRLYVTFENLQAVKNQVHDQLSLVFTTRYLADRSTARFNLCFVQPRALLVHNRPLTRRDPMAIRNIMIKANPTIIQALAASVAPIGQPASTPAPAPATPAGAPPSIQALLTAIPTALDGQSHHHRSSQYPAGGADCHRKLAGGCAGGKRQYHVFTGLPTDRHARMDFQR